jgi:dolichol-phosphate mannosyltransferase
MDADMQHDEKLLPQMLAMLKSEPVDLVVGSRYVAGGGIGGLDAARANKSALATRLSRIICKVDIAHPMSGFFMLRREVLEGALRRLSGQGFEILLDILASSPRRLWFKKLPYEFGQRHRGESKLDTLVAWEYMMLIADKLITSFRFVLPSSPFSAELDCLFICRSSGLRSPLLGRRSIRPRPPLPSWP